MADQAENSPTLSELERNLINFCETRWFLEGSLPTPETLQEKFRLTPKALQKILSKDLVVKSFEGRGMPVVEGRTLSPDQITAINTVLNKADGRSDAKKLRDMGVSPQQWAGWKQRADFKEYYRKRAENIFNEALPDAHLALVDRVSNGDLGAIKFYYEVTGHYTSEGKAVDLKMVLNRVFEIISLHIKNPEQLAAIGGDLLKLAGIDQPDIVVEEDAPKQLEL